MRVAAQSTPCCNAARIGPSIVSLCLLLLTVPKIIEYYCVLD